MDFQLVRREIMNKLFIIKSEKEINLLKENGIDNFVYPLFSFCVGVENEFSLSEIKEENSYLFVNRVLDEESANNLNMLLHKLPNNIKGIIFDDVGIIKMLEDVKIEKTRKRARKRPDEVRTWRRSLR